MDDNNKNRYLSAESENYQKTPYGFVTKKNFQQKNNSQNAETENNSTEKIFCNPYENTKEKNKNKQTYAFQSIKNHGVQKKLKEKLKKKPGYLSIVIIAIIFGMLPSAYFAYNSADSEQKPLVLQSHTKQEPVSQSLPKTIPSADWSQVVKMVQPSVVAIHIKTSDGKIDGSGVIIDKQGHIVTNYHVISSAINSQGKIKVQLKGGVIYDAKIVGQDPSTDLAVIKMENPPKDIVPAKLGTSSDLKVGSPVAAVGNPLGLDSTVTTGIISALNRPVKVTVASNEDGGGELVVTNAIQVDASINPGNSGGPLFDVQGRVIGINSSIASIPNDLLGGGGSKGSIGLGFAIPADLVKNIADQIIKTGKVEHPLLGVTIADGEGSVNNTTYTGAYVRDVVPNSPADNAGLQRADMIVDIDGNRVTSGMSLRGYVRRYKKGDKAVITYLRDGKEMQKEIVFTDTDKSLLKQNKMLPEDR